MTMRNLLIIAYYYPPLASSGSMRPMAFSRYLPAYGWRPFIMTTVPETTYPAFPCDPHLGSLIPQHAEIIRVPDRNPVKRFLDFRARLITLLRPEGTMIEHKEDTGRAKLRSNSPFKRALDKFQSRLFEFPDHQATWFQPVVKRAAEIIQERQIDAILATGSPWTCLRAGETLSRRFQLPFVADFRDPWVDNPYKKFSDELLARAKKLERDICSRANKILTNTDPLRVCFVEKYPQWESKFVTLTNGFDRYVLPIQQPEKKRFTKSKPTISHFGSIYEKRNPRVLLQALNEAVGSGTIKAGDLLFRFVGPWVTGDSVCDQLATRLEACGLVRRESAIPYNECLKQMAETDGLLILQPDSQLQIPGKLYEYIAAARPIVVIGGEGATRQLVTKHKVGICLANELSDIRRGLDKLVGNALFSSTTPHAGEESFDYCVLTGTLANILDELASEKARNSSASNTEICAE